MNLLLTATLALSITTTTNDEARAKEALLRKAPVLGIRLNESELTATYTGRPHLWRIRQVTAPFQSS